MQKENRTSHRVRFAAGPLLGALLLGLGCGAEAPATYRDYALRSAQANCQRLFRCCARSCSTTADASFNKSIENTQYAIDAGLVTFDAAKAESCLEANGMIYTDCTQYVGMIDSSRLSEACSNILSGTLPLGAACSTSPDYCKPDSYCAPDTSFTPAQLRCRRPLNVGDACDGSVRCPKGSACDVGGTDVCVSIPATAKFGEACSPTTACGASLVCLPDSTCGLPQEGGQACTGNGQCLSNRCAVDTCTVAMVKPMTVSDLICGP